MSRLFLAILAIIGVAAHCAASVYDEIAADSRRSGGIYYAYPVSSDSLAVPPEGYQPVFISHYGRHGSRWAIKEWKYQVVLHALAEQREAGNLTPFGQEVESMVKALWEDAEGNAGALTELGERQHKAIASRLFSRFPHLFADSMEIRAFSSTEPRCIVSMAAFCERLKELNPSLIIKRTVSPGNMDFIAYSTPAAKALGSENASWKEHYNQWNDTIVKPQRLMARMFVNPDVIDSQVRFMTLLHDIAIAEQNTRVSTGMLDIFTTDELFALWRVLDYDMYVKHANAAVSEHAGPYSAASLLRHVIDDADCRLASETPGVTLRFGHDTNLIRLLTLMELNGFSVCESDPDKYYLAWQDFKVAPMGANLQLIFFRNAAGKVIVQLRHNEHPVTLPIPPTENATSFYDWDTLRAFWSEKLTAADEYNRQHDRAEHPHRQPPFPASPVPHE